MRGLLIIATISMAAVSSTVQAADARKPSLPDAWLSAWREPSAEDRPLQIEHHINARMKKPDGMERLKNLGVGGVVCNVSFQQYMKSDENWRLLVKAVDACEKLGLVVWLYDEVGYPSGAAGGLVLAENKAFEAMELAFDAATADPFIIRPAYEFTHACNKYADSRRYINLLDDRADACFIRKTHDAYWQHLEKHFGRTIRAFFTDEPSLIAVNIGQLPDEVRKKIRIIDPLDPNYKALPCTPWCYDIVEQYRKRYGQDLDSQRKSLFAGDAPADRKIRRQYWALVADLTADRYYGQIQRWCNQHKVASSGHKLHEESILHHVPLDGNGLKVLGRMDMPGMDVLSSDPEHYAWMTPAMPLSAALLNGRRRLMTEVSDFSQKTAKKGPVSLDEMQATAAWQAAWGITEFTLYYSPKDRSEDEYRQYCQYVGRLNAILRPAQPNPETLLYYPIYDLWAEYRPIADRLELKSQSPAAQKIVGSFNALGNALKTAQVPFILIDHETLADARVDVGGKLTVAGRKYSAILFPEGIEPTPEVRKVAKRFFASGGRVLVENQKNKFRNAALLDALKPAIRLSPAAPKITLGRFQRDGRTILLLVNAGREPYAGELAIKSAKKNWTQLDPKTGVVESLSVNQKNQLPIKLEGLHSVLLIE